MRAIEPAVRVLRANVQRTHFHRSGRAPLLMLVKHPGNTHSIVFALVAVSAHGEVDDVDSRFPGGVDGCDELRKVPHKLSTGLTTGEIISPASLIDVSPWAPRKSGTKYLRENISVCQPLVLNFGSVQISDTRYKNQQVPLWTTARKDSVRAEWPRLLPWAQLYRRWWGCR